MWSVVYKMWSWIMLSSASPCCEELPKFDFAKQRASNINNELNRTRSSSRLSLPSPDSLGSLNSVFNFAKQVKTSSNIKNSRKSLVPKIFDFRKKSRRRKRSSSEGCAIDYRLLYTRPCIDKEVKDFMLNNVIPPFVSAGDKYDSPNDKETTIKNQVVNSVSTEEIYIQCSTLTKSPKVIFWYALI